MINLQQIKCSSASSYITNQNTLKTMKNSFKLLLAAAALGSVLVFSAFKYAQKEEAPPYLFVRVTRLLTFPIEIMVTDGTAIPRKIELPEKPGKVDRADFEFFQTVTVLNGFKQQGYKLVSTSSVNYTEPHPVLRTEYVLEKTE